MKKVLVSAAVFSLVCAAGSVSAIQLTIEEQMGRHVYMDKDLSLNRTQSCATCHHRSAGFVDPTNSRDPYHTMVSLGDDGISKGGRNAPTSAYAGFSPKLQQDENGEYYGGMFWDGRMTGDVLGDPLAEQAQGPPLNPVEMGLSLPGDVVIRVSEANYANLFINYFGTDFFAVLGDDATDDGYLDDKAAAAYAEIAKMVAAYERSAEVTAFNSQFDTGILTEQEQRGQALFHENCSSCHTDGVAGSAPAPLFTNYGYANIGVPVNDRLPTHDEDPNSYYTPPDLGLG
ncbi:MAG: cytochrome-c peroxidase, partial [Desulfurivibrio sp.]